MTVGGFIVCSFASTDEIPGLQGKRRLYGTAADKVYSALKSTVLAAGKFSVFEATASTRAAHLFERLHHDDELEIVELPYPWIGIRRRA